MTVKKVVAGVKVENASIRWFHGSVDDKIVAPEADVGLGFEAVGESAQRNVTHVGQSVKSAFFELQKRLTEQVYWTKARVANGLKMLENCSNAGVHHEVVRCAATLSIRIRRIKAASSEVTPLGKLQCHNESSEGGIIKCSKSGAGLRNVGRSS